MSKLSTEHHAREEWLKPEAKTLRDELDNILEWNVAMERYTTAYDSATAEDMVTNLVSEIEALIATQRAEAVAEDKERRQVENRSLCGCPFCTHHTDPYETRLTQLKSSKESSDE